MPKETSIPVSLGGYRVVQRFEDAGGCVVPTHQERANKLDLHKCASRWELWEFEAALYEVWIVAKPLPSFRPTVRDETVPAETAPDDLPAGYERCPALVRCTVCRSTGRTFRTITHDGTCPINSSV